MRQPTQEMIQKAQTGGYALGAFNVYNLEGVQAVIQAAEAESAPVMLQLHPKAFDHGGRPLVDLCLSAAKESAVPVAVHLDHSTSAEAIQSALDMGVQSVMADGSSLTYAANVDFTAQMARTAHQYSAAIEAELGKISGTEDGLTVAEFEARMTDPQQAQTFVAQTGVDMLAVCIGNVHGKYPGEPRLDFERLQAIRDCVTVPLVLHGASGLPDALITRAIALGICKFNVNTEVRLAYLEAMRREAAQPGADLLDVMQAAIPAMVTVVRGKLRLFGASGKAPH